MEVKEVILNLVKLGHYIVYYTVCYLNKFLTSFHYRKLG